MLWIVIPAKAPPYAKSRLSGVLTNAQRSTLAEAMARRTLLVARKAAPVAQIVLVSNSAEFRSMARSLGARAIVDNGTGVNDALRVAETMLSANEAMLVLPTDLPLLAAEDLAAILGTTADCVLAPNRARDGTNALFWRYAPRTFCFGTGSFSAHLQAAADQGLRAEIIDKPGLAFDIDEPQDLDEFCYRSFNVVQTLL